MPLLTSVDVKNLLGRFNHSVSFDRSWAFVIVHGPNGVGKTKLLELIKALSTDNLQALLSIPFDSLSLTYDDGSILTAHYLEVAERSEVSGEHAEDPGSGGLSVTLSRPADPGGTFILGQSQDSPQDIRRIAVEQELPVERAGPDIWWDYDQGDHITFSALRERYASHLLAPVIAELADGQEAYAIYQEFVQGVPTHLIETQRLLGPTRLKRGRHRDAPPVQMTVTKYAQDLTERLKKALAENSTTSQRLDRTFPERVLNAPDPDVTDQQVRERYEEQQRLRDRLAEVALLEESATLPLPDRELEEWELRVLQTYLEDADQKLATFKPVLDRVELLREIVNSHFLFKRLVIDQVSGFKFITDQEKELGPGALSSGEQHELVLAYALLFNVSPGSLVLIDEPEISLHVSWQQQFLNDLEMMAELQSLRFVIATHSPQVIDKWWERTEALYEGHDGDKGGQ